MEKVQFSREAETRYNSKTNKNEEVYFLNFGKYSFRVFASELQKAEQALDS